MTPAAKITYLAALLVGLSIGVFLGFQVTGDYLELWYTGRRITAPAALGDFAYMQYRRADTEHAKTALQTLTSFLEEMEKLDPDKTNERDIAFAYTRLALLEDVAHNPEQAHEYMTKARYWYKVGGGKDYPEEEMKAKLKALDDGALP